MIARLKASVRAAAQNRSNVVEERRVVLISAVRHGSELLLAGEVRACETTAEHHLLASYDVDGKVLRRCHHLVHPRRAVDIKG